MKSLYSFLSLIAFSSLILIAFSILHIGRFVGRHCEKRRGTGTDYGFEELDDFDDPIDSPGIIQNRRVGFSMGYILAILATVLAGILAILYKRFLVTHDDPTIEDDNSIKSEIRIHVVSGDNENAPAVN